MAKSVNMMRSAWRASSWIVMLDPIEHRRWLRRMAWSIEGRRVYNLGSYAARYLQRHGGRR